MEKSSKRLVPFIIIALVIFFKLFVLLHPIPMMNAAREGLQLWFNNVLPALLPFVIGANVLAGMGFIRFLGRLAAPLMQKLFNVPGAGAFALLSGLSSGYPMGAKAVAHLRETGQIERREAQRLMGFCNNAGPIFVVGVVGTSLFGSARAGYVLLFSHIFAALGLGLAFRFWGRDAQSNAPLIPPPAPSPAPAPLHFGQVLGDSVKKALETLALIGGFIILFCVVIRALEILGLFAFFARLGQLAGGQSSWLGGFVAGLLEVANGAKIIAQGGPPNPASLAATAALISFGGFSIHAQTAHLIQHTDIRFGPYLLAKCAQALVAAALCYFAAQAFIGEAAVAAWAEGGFVQRFAGASHDFILLVAGMLGLGWAMRVLKKR